VASADPTHSPTSALVGPGTSCAAHVRMAEKIRIEQHTFGGALWFGAWLFTIGYLKLTFWQGVLGLLLWPYYLGVRFSGLLP
jgi:hypothetical protein